MWKPIRSVVFASLSFSIMIGSATLSLAGRPISSDEIGQLHALGIDAVAIVKKIESDGIGFTGDDAALSNLKEKGVPSEVLAAIRNKSAAPATNRPLITYASVKQLVELGIDESAVIQRLSNSPTVFTLDATQERELRALGASETLFAALRGERPTPASGNEAKVTDVAVILDCSGSMKELTSDGKTKIDVARNVVSNMIRKYPDGLRLTLIVYGDTNGTCEDIRVVRPLSLLDVTAKSFLGSEIQRLE